jgi:hypothetical protein
MNPFKVQKFFKTWNETIGFFISFFLFLVSPFILRLFDPLAGSFDLGVLQVAIVSMLLFQWSGVVAWFTFRFNFPTLHRWMDDTMEDELTTPKPINEAKAVQGSAWFAIGIYFGYFMLMVLINCAFISMDVTW